MMKRLAFDIGGANLKAADGAGYADSRYFPLWQKPEALSGALREMIHAAPPADLLLATMTGELADCYRTKAEGVAAIIAALEAAAQGRTVRIYLTDGRFATPAEAREHPRAAAAANWHALARFAGRFAPHGAALLVDIGSTTSDLIPLVDGQPTAQGTTDPERLTSGELVYTGVERSPICAVAPALPWRGELCPTAQELFATTWDAYLLLNLLPEEPQARHTADGRPATREFARERLARAICADREMFSQPDAERAARAVADAQLALLGAALKRVADRLPANVQIVIVSGRGEFLARQLVAAHLPSVEVVSLSARLGRELSGCATSHALAVLADEEV